MKPKTLNNLLEVLELIDGIESMAHSVRILADKKAVKSCQSAADMIANDAIRLRRKALKLV